MQVRMFVKVLDGPGAERELRRLLRRHGDKIIAVAVVLELEGPRQASGLSRHYRMRPLSLPPTMLLEEGGAGVQGG